MEMELVDSVPAPAPTPSPAPQEPVAPVEPVAPAADPATPATPEATGTEPAASQLFKLPDGREVDAAGLQREYENLLPEFTRKSQRLAELERVTPPTPITTDEPSWKDPNYSPSSWAEAIEIAKAEALKELTANATAAQQAEAQTRVQVETELAEIKTVDPKVDENALFDHAVKFGFSDLKTAHSNYKAMRDVAVATEQRVLKNLQTRAADPISTNPTAPAVPKSDGYITPNNGQFRGALDFLEALKSKQ